MVSSLRCLAVQAAFTIVLLLPTAHLSSTGSGCITECTSGMNNEYHQSCERCDTFMLCSGGDMFEFPCAAGSWDDIAKDCVTSSTTCTPPPPVDGVWGSWDNFSPCSKSCGGGVQDRSRRCNDPSPSGTGKDCPGKNNEVKQCNTMQCPDCEGACPDGCSTDASRCGICTGNANITGVVKLCNIQTPLGNVEVYSGRNRLLKLTETGPDGRFQLPLMCADKLDLYFQKYGHTSVKPFYKVSQGLSVTVSMCANHILFTQHPSNVAVFEGSDVTLTCQATGVPPVTSYDWYKDFDVVQYGDDVQGDSSVYTIQDAKEEDSGHYQCRAESRKTKLFSTAAEVIVRDGGDDTCAEEPLPEVYYLPEGCTATVDGDQVTQINMGVCAGSVCALKDPSQDTTGMCCEMKTHQQIQVDCPTLTYHINRILTCGCGECADALDYEVHGAVKMVVADYPGTSSLPGREIVFYVGSQRFTTNSDGTFRFVVVGIDNRIVLQFRGGTEENYIPNIASVLVESGKTTYEILVFLQIYPEPIILDPTREYVLMYGISEDSSSLVNLTIPANSMALENGTLLSSADAVWAYQTFNDPRIDEELSLAPGDFSCDDSDGILRRMSTHGVLGLHLVLSTTKALVILPGNVEITFDPSADMSGVSFWRLDSNLGNWDDPVTEGGGSRRKRQIRQDENYPKVTTSFPASSLTRINIGDIDEDNRCWVKVYMCDHPTCQSYVANIPVCVLTKSNDNTTTVAKTTSYTDNTGAACVPVPCNREHDIFINTQFSYLASSEQNLPEGFEYTTIKEDTHILFNSPSVDDTSVLGGDGPVHTRPDIMSSRTCSGSAGEDYSFVFHFNSRPGTSKLTESEPKPGLPNSWYPEPTFSPERVACFVRIRMDSAGDNINAVATSYRGDSASGYSYGSYQAGVLHEYNLLTNAYEENKLFTCLEVKCPMEPVFNDSVTLPPDYEPAVFVEGTINTDESCANLTYHFDPTDGPIISEQTASAAQNFAFFMDPTNCDICDSSSDNYDYDMCYERYYYKSDFDEDSCSDPRLFVGRGAGRLAQTNAYNKCVRYPSQYVFRYDCAGGQVPE